MRKKGKSEGSTDPGTISTLLGLDTKFEGTFTFRDTIRVDGAIHGNLVSEKGTVIVGEKAVLEADVNVGVAIIRGTVNGRVQAGNRIEIYAPAKVNGDICAPTVTIDTGVVFNGKCEMASDAPRPKGGPAAPEGEPQTANSQPKTS